MHTTRTRTFECIHTHAHTHTSTRNTGVLLCACMQLVPLPRRLSHSFNLRTMTVQRVAAAPVRPAQAETAMVRLIVYNIVNSKLYCQYKHLHN